MCVTRTRCGRPSAAAGDGVVTVGHIARAYGALPLPVPPGPIQLAAWVVSRLPFLPPAAEWVEAFSHPAIMDTTRARKQLGWQPRYSGLAALRSMLPPTDG